MSKKCRIDGFTGTQKQYVAYLERQVIRYRHEKSVIETSSPPVRTALQAQDSVSAQETEHPSHRRRDHLSTKQNASPEFVFWSPDQKRSPQNAAWIKLAKGLVKDTPSAKEWVDKTRELGISSDARAIVFLISNDFEAQTYMETKGNAISSPPITEWTAIESLQIHAQATVQRQDRARLTLRFTRFSHFLILSASFVLLHHGAPRQEVITVVKICMGKNVSEKYAMDILRVVRFLNRTIDTLDAHGWGNRASQLLLICRCSCCLDRRNANLTIGDRTFASYHALCSYSDESLKFLQAQLCSDPYVDSSDIKWTPGEEPMPLFIPSLVHALTLKTVQ